MRSTVEAAELEESRSAVLGFNRRRIGHATRGVSSRNEGFAYNVIWSGPHAGRARDSLAMIFDPGGRALRRLRSHVPGLGRRRHPAGLAYLHLDPNRPAPWTAGGGAVVMRCVPKFVPSIP